jgi:hypothetical protein
VFNRDDAPWGLERISHKQQIVPHSDIFSYNYTRGKQSYPPQTTFDSTTPWQMSARAKAWTSIFLIQVWYECHYAVLQLTFNAGVYVEHVNTNYCYSIACG